jgi:large subunit ribosomal protein L29
VKKLRQLRKEIAQIKTVSRERELGVRGAKHELVSTSPADDDKKSAKKTVKKAAKSVTAKTGTKKSTRGAEKGAGK